MTQKIAIETVRCHILLTNTAREAVKQHVPDEHAFFNLQKSFIVYIEKLAIEQTQLAITLYFDNEKNRGLNKIFNDRVVIMDCVFDLKNGLVAKSFRTRGKGTPVATNRREKLLINFVPSRISGHSYPEKFIQTLAALPVAQERFDYVNKRISSWEGYLKVLDKNAAIDDIVANFTNCTFSTDFAHMTFKCDGIDQKQWKQLKGLSARMKGFRQEIGEVIKVNRNDRTVDIELKADFAKLARKNELHFSSEHVEFSNASTKSQLKRLLKGFERLKEGLAANANLENILFEDKPVITERRQNIKLEFHNQLNAFQQEAVSGAMSAEDLYVIQGPPGTGKTTVISEICYQNAKAGLKTLVASQSNLAVDNALSRLLSNKDIRILRYGRTESIEEEGKKFIEENVAAYWKKQTYEAVSFEIDNQPNKESELKATIDDCEQKLSELAEEKVKLELDIERKNAAAEQLIKLEEEISELKKQLAPLKKEREKVEGTIAKLTETKQHAMVLLNNFKQQLDSFDTEQVLVEKLQVLKAQYETVTSQLQYAELKIEQQSLQQQVSDIAARIGTMTTSTNAIDELAERISQLKKVHEVEAFMEEHHIRRNFVLDRLLTSLEKLQPELDSFKPLKDISARLEKAIVYSETTLGIRIEAPQSLQNHHYSLLEVNEFLTKLSRAFAEKKINAQNGTRSIQGLLLRRAYIDQLQVKYQDLIREVLIIFTKLKEELIDLFKEQIGSSEAQVNELRAKEHQLKGKLTALTLHLESLAPTEESVHSLQQKRMQLDTEKQSTEAKLNERKQVAEQYNAKYSDIQQIDEQLINGENVLTSVIEQLKEVNTQGLALEKDKVELEQLTKQNPELALANTEQQIMSMTAKKEKLHNQLDILPLTQELQNEWQSMLATASDYDLDEIRKLYVKHANVIGTTCVASANKEFMDNYPTFDVVIIDEVSKATPPELLLPMLKGAKIILVGDHHQLPPLVGDDTFEETLEQVIKDSDTFEEKRELEKLLEESLFERLYKNLPQANKKMLAIQYRMHENIMQTIAPFYKNENDALQCGLIDSNKARDHLLETSLFNRDNHLLWLDIPHNKAHFEERMKEGASLFNTSELEKIRQLLVEMNDATAQAKQAGLMDANALKSVGVISFYAEQVKRINRMIEQELNIPHLHIRTGSVDKFQGMEMDVILVSMVRNNDGHGDIGFAKDYRRLNVALSRARELLIMIGSTEMFTKRPKKSETRAMYSHLLNVVKEQDGYRA
ncbi:AAA domain-containing protein [Solibacillus sp. CAU 1738]|uniref:DEAD/DEAH box helicase n=1 Tax=Solibacillus sp. CAU 1738 TaxID=3140363 RepID=UPI00326168D5